MNCLQDENIIVEKIWGIIEKSHNFIFDDNIVLEDRLLNLLVNAYAYSDSETREKIRFCLKGEEGRRLFPFSTRFCAIAIRHKLKKYVYSSILIQSIENGDFDIRENIWSFQIIWFTAKYCGYDAKKLFDFAASRSSPKFSEAILRFSESPDWNKSLDGVGIRFDPAENRLGSLFKYGG